jgi:Leucine rich repeat
MHVVLSLDEFSYQQIVNKQNTKPHESLLITKLLNVNGASSTTDEPTTQRRVNSFKINQSLDLGASERAQQEDDQSLADKSLSKNPKYVNKSANSADKKNSMLLRKSLSISQSNEDGTWRCPNITDNRSLECGCDVPLTLRCSGDVHGLSLIAEGLKRSKSQVSILDCTLKNVTVLSESKIFEGVSLSGLFISSGEIKRVHRLAFSGLKTPLQILGLPNNALSSVPSNSLQQLTFLDRLDLSNNEIKILSPTDFVVSFGTFTTRSDQKFTVSSSHSPCRS